MKCHAIAKKYAYVICITKDREQIFNLDIREENAEDYYRIKDAKKDE